MKGQKYLADGENEKNILSTQIFPAADTLDHNIYFNGCRVSDKKKFFFP